MSPLRSTLLRRTAVAILLAITLVGCGSTLQVRGSEHGIQRARLGIPF